MKIFTSYFYQVRFFKPNMIPLSTAVWDPAWYHNGFKDNSSIFIDKNNVINGLRVLPLVPDETCSNLCHGRENCKDSDPITCSFLDAYHKQLQKINYYEFLGKLESHVSYLCNRFNISGEPFAVIMFHEALTNPCSERIVVQKWFAENGLEVTELNPKEY